MGYPNHCHPEARKEFVDIAYSGTAMESLLAAEAWVEAVEACVKCSTAGIRRLRKIPNRGELYFATSTTTSAQIGVAIVAVYGGGGNGPSWDVFASDVTGHSFWHGSDPADRSEQRLP